MANNLLNDDDANQYNYTALGIVAAIGHVIFGLYWTYVDPQPYESVGLRIVGFFTCITLLSTIYWPSVLRRFAPAYWLFTVCYNLPFFFTVNLINNNFSDIWFVAEATMILVVISFIPHVVKSLVVMSLGVFMAIVFSSIAAPESVYMNDNVVRHIPIYLLTLAAGYVFSFSTQRVASRLLTRDLQLQFTQALSGSIAHEMRNPLGSIRFYLQEIKQFRQDKKKTDYALSQAELSIRRSSQVIDLIMASIQNKPIEIDDFELLSAHYIVNKAVEEYALDKVEKARIQCNTDNDFFFKGSEVLCIYVLFNLLKNALYYTNAYPNSRINIVTSQLAELNVIKVNDTGPGIDSDLLPYLFDDFFTHEKIGGTGLGLSYCRRVMEAFGGSITCESTKGVYTSFTLAFPVVDMCDLLDGGTVGRYAPENSELFDSYRRVFSDKTLLIVDDQRVNHHILSHALSAYSVTILTAMNATEALQIVTEQHCDAMITDIHMPGVDGFQLMQMIRGKGVEIPVIGLTGDPRDEMVSRCEALGIAALLRKPVDAHALLGVLAQNLRTAPEIHVEAPLPVGKLRKQEVDVSLVHSNDPRLQALAKLIHDIATPVATLRLLQEPVFSMVTDVDGINLLSVGLEQATQLQQVLDKGWSSLNGVSVQDESPVSNKKHEWLMDELVKQKAALVVVSEDLDTWFACCVDTGSGSDSLSPVEMYLVSIQKLVLLLNDFMGSEV